MDKETLKRAKKRGRGNGRFVALPYPHIESMAWKALSPKAIAIYIEIRRRFNGVNNGDIPLSCREAATAAHCGKGTANRKLDELIEHGFIKINNKGHYGNRHSTTWILTTETLNNNSPTNEWRNYGQK